MPDTGWGDNIPAHWKLIRLRAILQPTSVNDCADYPLLSITREAGVILRDIDNAEENHNFIPDDLSNYKLLKKGQFGMNKMKAWQGSYGVSEYTGIVSPAYYTFNLCSDIVPEFFHLAIRSDLYISYFASASDGVRVGQWDLSRTRMKEIPLLAPPRAEQLAIADFLRDRTLKIGQAIQIKERQIELLKERKQILIQQAVTRGLNPDAPMCDSGIEWIGEIPAHWSIKRAKHLFSEVDERSPDGQQELLSVSHLTGVTPRSEKNVTMFMSEDYTGSKTCQKDDLIFNIMWAWMGALGVSDRAGIVSSAYGIYRQLHPSTLNPQYLELLLKTTAYIAHYNKVSTGLHSSRLRFYGHMFMAMEIGFPDREEQDAIVAYLDLESGKLNKAVDLLEQQITKLKEYKATLINSAVTGKIKVPGVVEPETRDREVA